MSRHGIIPYFYDDFEDLNPIHSLFDQHYTQQPETLYIAVMPEQQRRRQQHQHSGLMHKPIRQRQIINRAGTGFSEVTNEKDKFQIMLDVQQFKPEELTVKTIDNCVVVEAKHEEKEDEHGFISRQFVRRYVLPKEVKSDEVVSALTSDGVLMITAPKHIALDASGCKNIPIQMTNMPALAKPKPREQQQQPQQQPEAQQQTSAGGVEQQMQS